MMSFANGKTTALRIAVNAVKSKILFEPISQCKKWAAS